MEKKSNVQQDAPCRALLSFVFYELFAVDEKIFKVQKRKTEGRDEM